MKKIMSIILSLAVLFASVSVTPRAMAEDGVMTAEYNKSDAYFTVTVGSTTYLVVGYTVNTGLCECTTGTSYSIYLGNGSGNSYNKTLYSNTTVTMLNGLIPASDSYTGKASSYSNSKEYTVSKSCYYWVVGGDSSHDFSCNNKSGTSPSTFSLFYN